MPTNKNAYIRYQALDKCFRDFRHRYYIDDLLEKCEEALLYYNGVGGVSRRQLFEDIKFMESETGWSIPLERKKDGKKVYYRYRHGGYSINSQPLTDDEAHQLRMVILTLSRFKGLPTNEWVDDVISNLEWRFRLRGNDTNVIGFEQNEQLRGISWLSPIIDAAINQQALTVVYRNYKNTEREITAVVHPWYVKQYNNRWFLMAYNEEYDSITNFALDRIISIVVADDVKFIPNKKVDFEHYFDDVIGVTIPKEDVLKERIVLQFSAKQFPYVVSKPMHHSQKIANSEERTISIEVRPNYELEQQILSFGSDVEVLSPEVYRGYIRDKLVENIKKYIPVQKGCTDVL